MEMEDSNSEGDEKSRTEKVISKFLIELEPLLEDLKQLKPMISELVILRKDFALLAKDNENFKNIILQQNQKIDHLEDHIDRIELQNIFQERIDYNNSLVVHGFEADTPEAEIKKEITKHVENQEENISFIEKIGKPAVGSNRQLVKVTFKSLPREVKTSFLSANKKIITNSADNQRRIRFDLDRSPADRTMNRALLHESS